MENGRLVTAARFPLFGKCLTEFRRRSGGIRWDHFLARRVRGRKYISARKRAHRPAGRSVRALQWAAAISKKRRGRFFDVKRAAGDSRPFSMCFFARMEGGNFKFGYRKTASALSEASFWT